MNFKELHKTSESQQLEFKTSFGKEVMETVAAFCNASGGVILIGIDQKGKVKGVSVNDDPLVNLSKIGLLKEGQLTFAALLLFGEHRTGIHIGRFKTQDVIIDDILIKSPLATAVDEAMTFIKKNISLRYEFTGELRRKEIWQFPLPVIRELLLNAIIHKDYRNPTDIMIKIFDDSIQFVNPGGLMGGLNPEDLMKGNYIAMHRNKLLAEAFYLRGDIEKFGTGFFRIQSELKNSPEVGFKLESLKGFTRSGLEVVSQLVPTRREDTPQLVPTGREDTPQDTPQDNELITRQVTRQDAKQVPQDIPQVPQDIPQDKMHDVYQLLTGMSGEMTRREIQMMLKTEDRKFLRNFYLKPALEKGFIVMTIPDKPNSRHQKYRLTEKGKKMKQTLKRNETSM